MESVTTRHGDNHFFNREDKFKEDSRKNVCPKLLENKHAKASPLFVSIQKYLPGH